MYGEIYNAEWEEKLDCEMLHIVAGVNTPAGRAQKRPRICSAAYVKQVYKGVLHSTQHLSKPHGPESTKYPYDDDKIVIHKVSTPSLIFLPTLLDSPCEYLHCS